MCGIAILISYVVFVFLQFAVVVCSSSTVLFGCKLDEILTARDVHVDAQ